MRKAVQHPVAFAREYTRSAHFRRFLRYSSVSAVSTSVSLGGLYLFFRVLHVGTATDCNLLATAIASIPAYYLNRTWAWGKSGRSHVLREVVPFWIVTILGVVLSTTAVHFAAIEAKNHHLSKGSETLAVEFANFFTYGVLWFAKFSFFNRYLFKAKTEAGDEEEVVVAQDAGGGHVSPSAPAAPPAVAPSVVAADGLVPPVAAVDQERVNEVELA
jgi:putative flippase GtrA